MKTEAKQLRLIWKKIGQLDRHYYKHAQMPQGASVSDSIAYILDDHPMHALEVAYPLNRTGSLPVIVNIHGGAWIYGDKDSYYKYYCMELAQYGYYVINMNYRLAFDSPFPSMIEDIFSVFAWIKSQTQFQFDLDKVFLVGDSAGAHLAALSAQILQSETLQAIYKVNHPYFKIKALGLSSGVYDFDELIKGNNDLPLKNTLLEVIFDREDYQQHPLYPYASVSRNLTKDFTPCYVVSSFADPLSHESQRFVQELQTKDCRFKHHFFEAKDELPHVFNLKNIYPQSEIVNAEMIAFFQSI